MLELELLPTIGIPYVSPNSKYRRISALNTQDTGTENDFKKLFCRSNRYKYIDTYIHTSIAYSTTVVERSLSEVGNQIAANAGGRLKNIGWLRAASACMYVCMYVFMYVYMIIHLFVTLWQPMYTYLPRDCPASIRRYVFAGPKESY